MGKKADEFVRDQNGQWVLSEKAKLVIPLAIEIWLSNHGRLSTTAEELNKRLMAVGS